MAGGNALIGTGARNVAFVLARFCVWFLYIRKRVRNNMSVRTDEVVEHVNIKGTSISTSFAFPSRFSVTVLGTFGLPNRNGVIMCENHNLYVRFDSANDNVVYVWAAPHQDESWCTVC